jgi:hypothetical protein
MLIGNNTVHTVDPWLKKQQCPFLSSDQIIKPSVIESSSKRNCDIGPTFLPIMIVRPKSWLLLSKDQNLKS